MKHLPTSMVDILRWRAKHQPNQLAYRFLKDGENEELNLTYAELDRYARSIAAILQDSTKAGDRVLILFPPGLDFISAYFGCLYAKVIAIPLPPPHPARIEISLATILRMVDDATPSAALLNRPLFDAIKANDKTKIQFNRMKLLVPDKADLMNSAENWQPPQIDADDIAFLQYTSGSTTSPKGVMVSHNNLLHNLGLIEKSFGQTSDCETVIWLPPYHDMGLIGGILQPLYSGNPVTLIPHLMFLQRPIRWLRAITRYKATTSGGPNFAYDLCVRKIKPEQREQLDLSSWEVAFNGAESINQKTLDQFANYFAPCGFRREAFSPCYGLAEATLMVVGRPKERQPIVKNLLKSGLEQNKAIISPLRNDDTLTVVGCGQDHGDQKINIVDTETLNPCELDRVGEVWVSGASVALGYWNKPEETACTFGARLSDSDEGPFLRTGDLGFIHEGELYITGRLKNLIIIDGKNHYPHDLERSVESAHAAIRPAGCAVFSITHSGSERVVVMAEVQLKIMVDTVQVINAIRMAVYEHHEVPVDDIKLVYPGSIPRTTSGKIRHFLCRKEYLSGVLKEITLP